LSTILLNHARQRAREARARAERERSQARDGRIESAADTVARAQAAQRLGEAVLALDEPYRSTLLSHFQDGLSAEAIARRDRLPASTVRSRIARGLAELRRRLEQRDGDQWRLALAPVLVFERASSLSPIGAPLLTALSMKKLVAALVLIAAGAWFALRDGASARPDHEKAAVAGPALDAARDANENEDSARAPVAPSSNPAAPMHAPSSDRASLSVRVKWSSTGAPAAEVNVNVLEWSSTHPFAARRHATTDSAGRAHFEDVLPGSIAVGIDRAEGVSATVKAGEQRELELEIPAGIRVLGRVEDARGQSVAGARIWLSDHANSSSGALVARSDASGAFVVEHVGDSRSIAAFADDFAPSAQRDVLAGPRKTFEVTLVLERRGGALAGRVLDPQGQPLSGAYVLVGDENVGRRRDAQGRWITGAPAQQVLTDDAGRFALANLAPGTATIAVRHTTFAPWRGAAQVVEGETAQLEARLELGATLEGTVRGADGLPAARVFIGVGRYGDFASSMTRTDESGAFLLEGLAAGSIEVVAGAQERGSAKAVITSRPGERVRWDPVLEVTGALEGVVVDERGEPIVGWKVSAVRHENPGLLLRNTKTDGEGRFVLGNWPIEAEAITARDPVHWIGPAAVTTPAKLGDGPFRMVVRREDRPTARVAASIGGPDGAKLVEVSARLWAEGSNAGVNARYDADSGRVEAGPVKPGRYRLKLESPGLSQHEIGGLELAPESTLELGEVRFATPGRIRVKLTGRAEDLERSPGVSLFTQGGLWIGAIQLENGEGLSAPLAPGGYRVEKLNSQFARRVGEVEVKAGEEALLELPLEPGVYRWVSVTAAAATELPAFVDWELRDARGELLQSARTTPVEGKLNVFAMGLVVGRYSLVITSNDGRRATVEIDIADLEPPRTPIAVELR
jgi:5-hydroxyisourate hydrolase-like protein (transthyretin family)